MDANLSAAQEHAALAQEALQAAELLHAHALYRSSIDRSDYAAFHAASALLASRGIYPGSHDGVIAMLSLHFVKPGSLPKTAARTLQDLYNRRLIADCYLEQTAEEAAESLEQAGELTRVLLGLIP